VGTNGLLLDPRRSAFLARYGIRTSLSFDVLPVSQDQSAPGTFARLDATLDHLRQCHPRFFDKHLEVGLTLTAGNLQWLAGSVAYFLAKGVRTVHLNPRLTPDPEWRAVHFDEMDRQLARVYRLSRLVYDHSGRVPLVLFRKQGPRQRTRPRLDRGCGAATGRTLTVDVDGLATGCVLFASSYQATAWPRLQHGRAVLEIGSVTEPGFPRRLERYPQRALESGLLVRPQGAGSSYGQCSECRYRWHCGVCPATIAPSHDGQGGVPDLFCAFTRTALKYRDRFPRQPAKPGIPFVRTAAKLLRQLESGWPSRRRSRVPRSAPRLTP
jgi:sulfatase maturation enzyme AslB (radical SAM superfamily)